MTGQADTMLRSGFLAVRGIADFYGVEPEQDPDGMAELSVSRSDFDRLLTELAEQGVLVGADPDTAWEEYRGWRVNYDRAVCGLRERIGDGPSHWTRRHRAVVDDDRR